MNKEMEIYEFLVNKHTGHDKAVDSKKIEKKFDICPRTVRKYINILRKSGYPVCSDGKGYWIAKDSDEANRTVKRLGDFAGEVNNARTGLVFAAIQMRNASKVTEGSVQITVKVS